MKKKRKLKIISIILTIIQIISICLVSYSIYLYKGIETFYRIIGVIILIYLFLLLTYLLFKSIKKKKKNKSFIILTIIIIILTLIELTLFYYLYKIYNTINSYSDNTNMYYTSLVTYDKTLDKNINNKIIGLINDKNDIEGNILAEEIIEELKLKDNNTINYYDSTIELLYALKENKINAALFSSNYVEMFSSMEDFENIEEETKVIYSKEKEYIIDQTNDNKTNSALTDPFTMLLIGVDSSKDGVTSGYNADVLLLVSFNPKTLRATLTSIPRDMYIQTSCSGSKYRRINTTTWGSSSSCAVNTVENLFDVDIDYYAKINFKGVVELVDAVGGIDVSVDYSICDQNSSRKWGNNTVYIEKGKQHLNGEQALVLARNRHKAGDGSKTGDAMSKYCPTYTDGSRNDYTRGKNQMKIILGIISSATKLKDPNQAINILETISDNFQTNINSDDVISLYNLGKSIFINDASNLINVQRLQLSGKNVWGSVYDTSSKSYPAITLPYKESINEIKNAINENLGKKESSSIKEISFDLNNLYEDVVLGSNKNYSNTGITTLNDMSDMSVSSIKEYIYSINKTVLFMDIDSNEEVYIDDYSDYYFYKQSEHKDTIINQFNTVTIYVKKRSID